MKLTNHLSAVIPKLHLVGESPVDALLLERLAAALSGDAAVRLTLLLDLLERHEAEPAREVA